MVYDLPGVQIHSSVALGSFEGFLSRGQSAQRVVGLHCVAALPLAGECIFTAHHKEMDIAVLQDGWRFSLPGAPQMAVQLSPRRDEIIAAPMGQVWQQKAMLPLLRTAIECASAMAGVISLHSACLDMEEQGLCFTAASGVGKSTRAMQWAQTTGAGIISGDRPSLRLDTDGVTVCGVPWDGKEQIYRNVQRPLKMICVIRRGERVRAKRLSRHQARQILMQQTFIPMWDTEAAAAVMATIRQMLDQVTVIELQCGPDSEAAKQAYDLIYHHPERIEEEAQ